jgi:integrase
LILLTGCRKGEVLGLQWSWVESNLIRIPWEFHKTGQTGGEKLIHLSPQAVEILEGIPKNGERVFPNQKGGNLWGIDPLWRQIRTDLELPSVHIHDLRHSYASLGINAGMSLGDIGVLLGHASITTTRRYAHIDQSYKIQKALQMGELLAEAMKPKT